MTSFAKSWFRETKGGKTIKLASFRKVINCLYFIVQRFVQQNGHFNLVLHYVFNVPLHPHSMENQRCFGLTHGRNRLFCLDLLFNALVKEDRNKKRNFNKSHENVHGRGRGRYRVSLFS